MFKLKEDGFQHDEFETRPVSLEVHFEGEEVGEDGTKKMVILDPLEGSFVVCREINDGWIWRLKWVNSSMS